MKFTSKVLTALTLVALSPIGSWAADKAADAKMPDMPKPTAEHAWLQQFVGEWDSKTQCTMPGAQAVESTGTETVRNLGEFWTINDVKSQMMGQPYAGNMTLGYDVKKKKYVGTWIDSMTGHLWEYEGNVDKAGKVLTLESEGECPMKPGMKTTFRDVIELKDKDHKTITSSMKDEKGKWVTMMTGQSERKH